MAVTMENKPVQVLISCNKQGRNVADKFSQVYSKIFLVEYNTDLEDFDTSFKYAKAKGMSHVLFFLDDINLYLSSLSDDMGGYTVEVTIDDLEKVLSQNAHDNL